MATDASYSVYIFITFCSYSSYQDPVHKIRGYHCTFVLKLECAVIKINVAKLCNITLVTGKVVITAHTHKCCFRSKILFQL